MFTATGTAEVDYTAAMVEEFETPQSKDAAHPQPDTTVPEQVETDGVEHVVDDVVEADDTPSVDELQGRLAELQGAMDQLQSGDLDGAEATIASLEQAMSATSSTGGGDS